ncbi:hypothetical protein [Aeoliella mucimassa]|uniref:Oligogalacturonide lyase n=1 Tax=Aeoliella mucimassa TaxID=2527972 RepID=A0A518AH21_9BACT|nr:hypothetical protein [Aeoliella mucimassa]QDU54018.1 hypothetical protein Pan181_01980 [Aeoliella mucimassa]
MIDRRTMLAQTAAGLAGLYGSSRLLAAEASRDFPPVRTITQGPKHHWFGYYDKWQFDPTDRYVLSNQVDFEHRSPRAGDTIQVGMVNTEQGDHWIELGKSQAWGWQQGCMLQWIPGTLHEVLWNDREADRYVARRKNVITGEQSTLPHPIYTISPDGKFGLSLDFARLQRMRPGYGYVGLDDRHPEQLAPADEGIFKVDLSTGESTLLVSLADVAKIPFQGSTLDDRWHYFNHLLVSPDSQRFIFLHRWRARHPETGQPHGGFTTRMFTANIDGSDLYVLDPSGNTSHFIWRDPQHVCMWTHPTGRRAGYYVFEDKTSNISQVGEGLLTQNGHNTYLPGTNNEWMLSDTYPDGNRNQKPFLFHIPTSRLVPLGEFYLPPEYRGESRCDTHPRYSRDGRTICIDSPHTGSGRQLHLIDVSEIIG